MTTLDDMPELDLTVDGADEIDPKLRLIKGGGGALLREKIVAAASERMAVIADASKSSPGSAPFRCRSRLFRSASPRRAATSRRRSRGSASAKPSGCAAGASPFVTDGGHFILDCALGAIPDPEALAEALSQIPGVVEHGLFIGYARVAFAAGADGVETLRPQ